jgi:hypothetical protein
MQIVVVPAIITLAVTLLRLFGELQHWSPNLFNPVAGGGGALIGISSSESTSRSGSPRRASGRPASGARSASRSAPSRRCSRWAARSPR